jgi:hypothetical protein
VKKYGTSECGEMGGGWCNYVFEHTPFPALVQADGAKWTEIGPFKDGHDRAMRFGPKRHGFTAETCAAECKNFKYFGLEGNGQCWCDNDLAHSTKHGPGGCGKMGGDWCMYIYEQALFPTGALRVKELGPYKD